MALVTLHSYDGKTLDLQLLHEYILPTNPTVSLLILCR
jgi:hypothetical protein